MITSIVTTRQLVSILHPNLSFTHIEGLGDVLKVATQHARLDWESLANLAEDCRCRCVLVVTPEGQTIACHSVTSIKQTSG
jgi:hypothetical protein